MEALGGRARSLNLGVFYFVSHSDLNSTLAGDGQRACNLFLGTAEARRVVQLAGGVLEAQPEQVPARCLDVFSEFESR